MFFAKTWAFTAPYSPSSSVSARADSPFFCAKANSSSGWLAPFRKEKFDRQTSSAYTGGIY